MLENFGLHMLKNRFKPVYIDLETGKWYVTNETSDSNLKGLRVRVTTPSDSWFVTHWRRTTRVYVQVLDNTNSEIIPESIDILDDNSVQINFAQETTGVLHLIFTENDFYNIWPSSTPSPTTTPTPTP